MAASDQLHFTSLIKHYADIQKRVLSQIKSLSSQISQTSPGQFLLVQFMMSQVTQIGDSISNLIAQSNSVINNAVRNQKGQ